MSICVSRFMFRLRETYMTASSSELNTTDFPNIASVRHSRSWVVGNLGAALDVSDEQEREESDEVSEAQAWNESQERLIPSIVSHNPLWEGLAAGLERPPASGLEDITTRGRALSVSLSYYVHDTLNLVP